MKMKGNIKNWENRIPNAGKVLPTKEVDYQKEWEEGILWTTSEKE